MRCSRTTGGSCPAEPNVRFKITKKNDPVLLYVVTVVIQAVVFVAILFAILVLFPQHLKGGQTVPLDNGASRPSVQGAPAVPVKIGILAKRGTEHTLKRWGATAAYLEEKIHGYTFTIIPLDFRAVRTAVINSSIDFLLTNTGYYVELEADYGVSRIATLRNLLKQEGYQTFGGVIFTRTDNTDIYELKDLKGKRFMAVDPVSFGGWRMALRELVATGIDPKHDLSKLNFGGTHDAVVHAVLKKRVDAGTVRTDTLEQMAEEGKIDISELRTINDQPRNDSFPFLRSTRLYPEWPFAKLKQTPELLAEQVAIALLNMPSNHPAARTAKIAGWTIPLDYGPAHELMKELQLGPYQYLAELDEITLVNVIKNHPFWFIASVVLALFMTLAITYVSLLNRRLGRIRKELNIELNSRITAEQNLKQAHDELEIRIEDRTRELSQANLRLTDKINECHLVEEALKSSQQRVLLHLKQTPLAVIEWNLAFEVTEWNLAAEKIFGYPKKEVMGRHAVGLIVRESNKARVVEVWKALLKQDSGEHYTNENITKNGEIIYCEWYNTPLVDEKGEVIG